jgi:hypothetical protein
MPVDANGWPIWTSPAHVVLNRGKASRLKLYGDLLIPALPHNLLISVKSVSAKERLIVSGNRLESVGFGFFYYPSEFWTKSRITLFKRWGFTAIYMPVSTHAGVVEKLHSDSRASDAVNVNGRPLYRPLTEFGADMARIAGRTSLDL